MDTHDAEILHQLEPDERPDFGDSLWIDSDGFSPFRTTVIKLACAALDCTEPHLLEAELEDLEHWICQLDNMRINPDLQDWENCRNHQALWQRHVLDRDYDENTARLLGHSKGRLPIWNVYADVHKVDNLIIIPIRSQAELATEAALQQPDLYPKYVNRCIANTARVFVVMDDNTGRATTLCALRFRKGRWQLSYPAQMMAEEETLRALTKFAKLYNTRAPRNGRKHRVGTLAEEHDPSKDDPHHCPLPQQPERQAESRNKNQAKTPSVQSTRSKEMPYRRDD